jgi:hypothetical protein
MHTDNYQRHCEGVASKGTCFPVLLVAPRHPEPKSVRVWTGGQFAVRRVPQFGPGAWIALNTILLLLEKRPIEKSPFFWMQGVISLGALYMTVLITQRREK